MKLNTGQHLRFEHDGYLFFAGQFPNCLVHAPRSSLLPCKDGLPAGARPASLVPFGEMKEAA